MTLDRDAILVTTHDARKDNKLPEKKMDRTTLVSFISCLILVCPMNVHGKHHHSEDKPDHHWDWDSNKYDECPTSDYCNYFYSQCTSDKGYEVCMKDVNRMTDPCDDVYICKDVETFKQGIGSLVILIVVSIMAAAMFVVTSCVCYKYRMLQQKLKKRNMSTKHNAISAIYPGSGTHVTNTSDEFYRISSPPPPYREHNDAPRNQQFNAIPKTDQYKAQRVDVTKK
ncbi:unnamed protein product [Mytilus edulis]|uniref:Uncharacterized protein n=1 Tax=Mytilus edulis TaxID=6550 RepID=A0A8S3Q3S3_MYTED|nr:unnamed protein product [Mytilus edulis]